MTEEEYRNLKIDDVVYNTSLRIVRKISSQLADKANELNENYFLWTNDLSGEYLSGGEGLYFKSKADWQAVKYKDECDLPDWFKIECLQIRLNRLECFVHQRLRK